MSCHLYKAVSQIRFVHIMVNVCFVDVTICDLLFFFFFFFFFFSLFLFLFFVPQSVGTFCHSAAASSYYTDYIRLYQTISVSFFYILHSSNDILSIAIDVTIDVHSSEAQCMSFSATQQHSSKCTVYANFCHST